MDLFDFRILGSSAKSLDYRLQLVTTTKVFFFFEHFTLKTLNAEINNPSLLCNSK